MNLPLLPDLRAESLPRHGEHVARAMALLWTFHPVRIVADVVRSLDFRRPDGREYPVNEIKRIIGELDVHGALVRLPERDGYYRLRNELRASLYRELLESQDPLLLRRALFSALGYQPQGRRHFYWPVRDQGSTIAILHAALFTGLPETELDALRQDISASMDWNAILMEAGLAAFDAPSFERIAPRWRWELADWAVSLVNRAWNSRMLPVADWLFEQAAKDATRIPHGLKLNLAEILVHRGEREQAQQLLANDASGAASALRACLSVQDTNWDVAQTTYEAAIKQLQVELKARKRLLPESVAWYYPLALIAQRAPQQLQVALKFCVGEAGERDPSPYAGWGMWAHALKVRLGETSLQREPFERFTDHPGFAGWPGFWCLMLAAWLGPEAFSTTRRNAAIPFEKIAEKLGERLRTCRFEWLAAQTESALGVMQGKDPPRTFFVGERSDRWREILASLNALGAEPVESKSAGPQSRILWQIRVGAGGAIESIAPFEQRRGARGWSKPKAVALSKLSSSERLTPWDARVARSIRRDKWNPRSSSLDPTQAILALVGHPAVVLAHRPEQLIDLVEGTPTLEVVKAGERVELRIDPPLRPEAERRMSHWSFEPDDREAQTLRLITLVEDSPQRARVIRFTPAQRRAAQLVAGKLAVPASAREELEQALRALAGHFEIHADEVQAAREVPSEAKLRAELSPLHDGLLLRLVVAPLGPEGPRLAPGSGRARLMAAISGESIGTTRDLERERAHAAAVLDALPFLGEMAAAGTFEWNMDDPELALATVETLPKIDNLAGIDWPKGKSVRVITVDSPQVAVAVSSQRGWFRLSGRVRLDEDRVLDFGALLDAARGRSRFVPLGDGTYAALTSSLKERLADLSVVVEADRKGLRVPRIAAAWLDQSTDGMAIESDRSFRLSIDRLREAQEATYAVPRTLQAELRPYQVDGFLWAMRLAAAGFGACLADDMGLGKTLQALAVLLTRSQGGAALVVAPTSVCGNWVAEAQRFAPSLNVHLYADTDRTDLLARVGAFDVVVVSYTLLQQAAEAFRSRGWHTLIADEAQAIKNSAAKRSLALFDLEAEFRMALSGTPVENRLSELWSIMSFLNPGLLGTAARFRERFATPIERDRNRETQQLLRRVIAPFVLRRTKAQVLHELPARTEIVLPIAPSLEEASHYEALRRSALAQVDAIQDSGSLAQSRFNILAQLMKLRRAACDPRLASPDLVLVGAKVQAFAELVTELIANGHKALVFSQFVDFLALLREPLDRAGVRYQYLDGATPQAERTRRVAAFQSGEGDLFLVSLKAGGFGLNLTAADYVVITDPWWNPAAEDQATGRAHRIGQQRPVTVYRLVTQDTIEERILELHQDKRSLAESILAEGEASVLPTTEELISLMELDRPHVETDRDR